MYENSDSLTRLTRKTAQTITAPEFVAKYLNAILLQAGCFNCFCIFSNNRGGDFVQGGFCPGFVDCIVESLVGCRRYHVACGHRQTPHMYTARLTYSSHLRLSCTVDHPVSLIHASSRRRRRHLQLYIQGGQQHLAHISTKYSPIFKILSPRHTPWKMSIKRSLNIPPRLNCVAILPCEI